MSDAADRSRLRRYSVHGREGAPARGHQLDARGFEDAALTFLEQYGPDDDGDEVAVMVEDCETGERQCFRVELSTGDTRPCD